MCKSKALSTLPPAAVDIISIEGSVALKIDCSLILVYAPSQKYDTSSTQPLSLPPELSRVKKPRASNPKRVRALNWLKYERLTQFVIAGLLRNLGPELEN